VGLLITAFTLPGIILVPIMGILADKFGRKKILVPSLMLFGIAGGSCFFFKNFSILLLLRFLQGIGGIIYVILGMNTVFYIGSGFSSVIFLIAAIFL